MSVKQVIVMRKDLNMRRGKQIAQGAHASMKVFFDRGQVMVDGSEYYLDCPLNKDMVEWVEGKFTKICVSVDSEHELFEIYNNAKKADIPCAMITDIGKTEFNSVPTNTCVALGPDSSEKINKITGHLKLL